MESIFSFRRQILWTHRTSQASHWVQGSQERVSERDRERGGTKGGEREGWETSKRGSS